MKLNLLAFLAYPIFTLLFMKETQSKVKKFMIAFQVRNVMEL